MQKQRLVMGEQLEVRRLLAFDPTASEQEFMQLTNRFRTDPGGEFSRLIASVSPLRARDPIFQNELEFFSVNGSSLRSELQALNAVPPLAWNAAVSEFARSHNQAMLNRSPPTQFHSNTIERRQALLDAGVNLRSVSGELINSENVYGFAKSPLHLFASYIIDWGTGAGGMQANRPHRAAINNGDHDQVGHAITSTNASNFGPLVNTQVLVNIESSPVMVVGAVFEDSNDSGWYDAGEGIRRVNLEFSGPAGTFTTTAWTAGGYQIELPPGTYTARAFGGDLPRETIVNNIVVGNSNVWRNIIFDPDTIPPDNLEPNNSIGTATATTGRDQSFTGLSIHVANDVDLFSFTPAGSGDATFRIQFSNSAGNLGLQLLSASSTVLAASDTTANSETITHTVTRGTTYFIRVHSVAGARNGSYNLTIDAPEPQRPVANPDRATMSSAQSSVTINVLANDTDPDGDRSQLTPRLAANAPSIFSVNSSQRVVVTPAAGTPSGVMRTSYTVTDDQGLVSTAANIDVLFINFTQPNPWHNSSLPTDINGDNQVTPLDILTIVNDLNTNQPRRLPTSGSVQGFLGLLDANGDDLVTPIDILTVINYLNASAANGEPPPQSDHGALHDQALLSFMDEAEEQRRRGVLTLHASRPQEA